MKILITTIALSFALPAMAQIAPAAQSHHGHAQHHQSDAGHAGHQMPQGQQSGQNSSHQGHRMQMDCCADRNGNGRMDCCEGMSMGAGSGRPAQPQPARPQAGSNR